jgi:hypothetical protein
MTITKIKKLMTKQGKLTFWAKFFLTLSGLGIIYLSLAMSPNIFVLTLGLCIGFVLVSLVTYSNKSESLDLPAPFTNDPLGWRKAKQSYKEEAAPEEDSEKKTKT